MHALRATLILAPLLVASCATNPLNIPPPKHAIPVRVRPDMQAGVAESRPEAVASGYDAADGDGWRKGDALTYELVFDQPGRSHKFWLTIEVTRAPDESAELPRATVRTTLRGADGCELGTSPRRVDPTRLPEHAQDVYTAYAELITDATNGVPPADLQESIDADMDEGSPFYESQRMVFREIRRTAGPRYVRNTLKDPAIAATVGNVSIFDLAVAAFSPIKVLVDVNRLVEEQQAIVNFSDMPVSSPLRIPYVMTMGSSILFRFVVTIAPPLPPYALAGGVLEIAGVNEEDGNRQFSVRLISAKRGSAEPEL